MLKAFRIPQRSGLQLEEIDVAAALNAAPGGNSYWIDLIEPSASEVTLVEGALKIDIPTREEMGSLEASSRFYVETSAIFLTTTAVAHGDTDHPSTTPITFVLARDYIVSLRYADLMAFRSFRTNMSKRVNETCSPESLFLALNDEFIERLADLVEGVGKELDRVSEAIFRRRQEARSSTQTELSLQVLVRKIGERGDLLSKLRESLLSFHRSFAFLLQEGSPLKEPASKEHLLALAQDVQALLEHSGFLSSKISFLLEASLGIINIQQSHTIKIFSVLSVILLPPTLIASIYGMNFQMIPELHWKWGYPVTLGVMLLSAILPYVYFKRRGWF